MTQDKKESIKNLQELLNQPIDVQLEIFSKFVELSKLFSQTIMEKEVEEKVGERYKRMQAEEERSYSRWGNNPGSIRIGEEKVKIKVPRMYDHRTQKTISPESYSDMHSIEIPAEMLLKRIILGLSQRDYKKVTQQLAESFGLSQSNVSREFIEESSKVLDEFEKRDLGYYDFVALVIDGKHLSKEQIVIAMGITSQGDKIPLGFIQTTTENSKAITGLLKDLINRNFKFEEGILAIIDGSKGLKKALQDVFGEYVVIQRCQWHKRENVISYMKEDQKESYKKKIQRAYLEPLYENARSRLLEIRDELSRINRSAASSLEEGLEETLTIHRLGLADELGKSLMTTNTIENLNSHLEKYLRKVRYWRTNDMKARWIASALVDIEKRMRRINNYNKLHLLKDALKTELNIDQKMVG